ncbi:vWA domain-containing protein [Nocardioides sp. Kera G14]|uniref:vWA domain-containing protein n=1 Tax=Nocardioides sp. Kera G14 TaxID=2884264 RepID=UPI001D12955D|nr:VWA domain-containing protein [Nocardioides sp. Kera G14]UDY23774.1 VWA domain-containing protein [Nocardioides sp. Kera G14]
MGIIVRPVLMAIAVACLALAPTLRAYADDSSDTGAGEPTRLILLLDSSGSMKEAAAGGTKIGAARRALTQVIGGLPEDAPVGLRVFGAKVFKRTDPGACEDTQLVVPVGTDNRDALSAAVPAYKPWGETPIPAALKAAAGDLGDEGSRSIMLVSDGESTCGDPCPVAKDLARTGIDLTINVVGLAVTGKARQQLQCIADAGNGTYYDADSAADIESTLEHVATRAMRPFTITGQPIVGGTESTPTPVTVGDWSSKVPAGEVSQHYVFTRKKAGSAVRVAVYHQMAGEGIRLTTIHVVGPDGTRCEWGVGMSGHNLDFRAPLAAENGFGGPGAVKACDGPGDYRIDIDFGSAEAADRPYGLRVVEEPPLADTSTSTASASPEPTPTLTALPPAATATPVVGASGFSDAPEIMPGTWSSTIVPGEFDVFRFHLDYGQSARVSVVVPKLSDALQSKVSVDELSVTASLFSPMYGELPNLDSRTQAEYLGQGDNDPLLLGTLPVSAAHIGSSMQAGTSLSGDYYLGVGSGTADASYEFPFTITLEIDGEAQPGPTYADGETWTLADGLDPSAGQQSGDTRPGEGSTKATDSKAPLIGGGVAALVVIAGVGAWLVSRRRGRGAAG